LGVENFLVSMYGLDFRFDPHFTAYFFVGCVPLCYENCTVCFGIRVRTLQKLDAQEPALLTPLSTMKPSILDDSLGALFIAVITSGVYVTLSFYSPAY
jgi:hypothetical protein